MGKYLYYYLQSAEIQKQIEIAINAGTQKNVGLNSLSNFLIYVPDEDSIDKIVEILSDTDRLISSLQKLIEKKKAIKQGTMQELLTGKNAFRGFLGVEPGAIRGSFGFSAYKCIYKGSNDGYRNHSECPLR